MNARHLELHVIRPTLAYVGGDETSPAPGFQSAAAVELLLGTAAQELHLAHLVQLGGGPALGLYQIEPATHDDIWASYLDPRPMLRRRIQALLGQHPDRTKQLVGNLAYATAIARLIYWRSPVRLAPSGDVAGHARVWKQVYNTRSGKGTEAEFIANWQRLVAPSQR